MKRFGLIVLLLALSTEAWAQLFEGVTQVGLMLHRGISESSGLIASRRYPGVLWTHNDGGYQFLFAVNPSGRVLATYPVPGNLEDWEDIATDSLGNLYLADTGSNGVVRTHVAVHRVKEPNPYAKRIRNAVIDRTWLVRFPEGRQQDCEAFFVHDNFGYLISKRPVIGTVKMYRFSLADRRTSIPLQLVALIPIASPVTAADLSRDSQRLGLTTSDGVYLYFVNGRPPSANLAQRLFFRFQNRFMEGGTFFNDGFLTSSETRQIWSFSGTAFVCQDPAQLTSSLDDRRVSAGTPVRFEVSATGCPFPQFAWQFNGQFIPGATNAFFDLPSVSPADAGVYQVIAYNRYGAQTNSATLSVRTTLDIRITEVMPSRADDAIGQTEDWFELTNFEPFPVRLTGWSFNDQTGGLSDAFVFTNDLVIDQGETIIFVENLFREEFRTWWGTDNMPDVRIITYSGAGLSFSGDGDTLFLWDALGEPVTSESFGPADPGISFIYNPITDDFGTKSELGSHGAVQAINSSDIGSPGKIVGP